MLQELLKLLNKLFGSRKAALHDQLTTLTAKYMKALKAGKDTEAAQLKKQIVNLRSKAGFTGGDV